MLIEQDPNAESKGKKIQSIFWTETNMIERIRNGKKKKDIYIIHKNPKQATNQVLNHCIT